MISKPRVDWVHPSVRDLVIDHLASNRAERQRFLKNAGPRGVALALSFGGGATGSRSFPLMVEPDDWLLLGERVKRLIEGTSDADRRTVLQVLSATRKRWAESVPAEVLAIVSECLPAIARHWDDMAQPLDPSVLARFFDLSLDLDPFPSSPQLLPTWERCWSDVTAIDVANINTDWCYELAQWLDLLRTIEENEPRFLRRINFPSSFATELQFVAAELTRWIGDLPALKALDGDEEWGLEEPGADEEEELDVLVELPDLLSQLRARFTDTFPDNPDLDATIDLRREERADRRADFDNFNSHVPDNDRDDRRSRGVPEPSVHDIFTDL